jgi:surfeit locus 1 family protein
MSSSAEKRPRRGLLLPGLMTLFGIAVTVSLGTWQVERKVWKEDVLAHLSSRLAAVPAPLPAPAEWPRLTAAQAEFQRVTFTARFLHDKEALVYTTGSSLHEGSGGPGYWVFTPARLADGSVILVNRGFVPEGRQDPNSRREGQIEGSVEIVGALRWPDPGSMFTPKDDPGRNLWFTRDPVTIGAAKALATPPFYVEQEAPMPPGRLPLVGRLRPNLPNNHLGYALTWFGLAAGLLAVFAVWALRGGPQAREGRI